MPAFVQLRREGVLESLDDQHCAAEKLQPLILEAVLTGIS